MKSGLICCIIVFVLAKNFGIVDSLSIVGTIANDVGYYYETLSKQPSKRATVKYRCSDKMRSAPTVDIYTDETHVNPKSANSEELTVCVPAYCYLRKNTLPFSI